MPTTTPTNQNFLNQQPAIQPFNHQLHNLQQPNDQSLNQNSTQTFSRINEDGSFMQFNNTFHQQNVFTRNPDFKQEQNMGFHPQLHQYPVDIQHQNRDNNLHQVMHRMQQKPVEEHQHSHVDSTQSRLDGEAPIKNPCEAKLLD